MLSTQDTQNLGEQEGSLIQISIERSRLVIIDAISAELGLNRDQVIRLALMMGLGALCHPANSVDVRGRFIARD